MTDSGAVQLRLKALGREHEQVRLALTVDCAGDAAPVFAAAMVDPFAADQGGGEQRSVGLALVKRAVELMGGQVTIDTTSPGKLA